ncbi:hypothetical protein EAH79_08345 [Sphingomonas koreensis]|nr:hypothetical protein EAH79_08345 [Sphingomonas koreensis]
MRSAMILTAMVILAAQAAAGNSATTDWTPGTIDVELAPQPDEAGAADQAFADAVSSALAAANFMPLPGHGHGRYVADVTVTRRAGGAVTSDADEPPATADAGDWTVRLGVTLPSRKTQLHGLIVTQLDVHIRLRGADRPIWSGSAMTAQVDGTRAGAPAAVAGKLADALIPQFPNTIEGTIAVP